MPDVYIDKIIILLEVSVQIFSIHTFSQPFLKKEEWSEKCIMTHGTIEIVVK